MPTKILTLGVAHRDDSLFQGIPGTEVKVISTANPAEVVLRSSWLALPPAALSQAREMEHHYL